MKTLNAENAESYAKSAEEALTPFPLFKGGARRAGDFVQKTKQ
jgi:hypothetical protein